MREEVLPLRREILLMFEAGGDFGSSVARRGNIVLGFT